MLKSENLAGLSDVGQARVNLDVYSKIDVNTAISNAVKEKVDKTPGKQLSTNDYTTEEKEKLANINTENIVSNEKLTEELAKKENALPSGGTSSRFLRGDKKWVDFAHAVRSTILTGLNTTQDVLITAKDSVLGALGKLQGQISAILTKLNSKADLVNGKVPSSQLPKVQAIDESNLVHRNGDEVIGGVKTFENGLIFINPRVDLQIKDLTFSKHDPKETQTISQYAKATNGTPGGIHFTDYVAATPSWLTNWAKEFRGYLSIGDGVRTFDRFQVRGYERFDGTEASLANARKYIKLDAPKILLGDEDILGEWKSWTPTNGAANITKHHCRYKKIGKTCHFLAEVYVNNVSGNTPGFTLPILRANYGTEFVVAGYCVRRGENPATQSRGAISFSGRDRFSTLVNTDVGVFDHPGEYIIRASGTYETE